MEAGSSPSPLTSSSTLMEARSKLPFARSVQQALSPPQSEVPRWSNLQPSLSESPSPSPGPFPYGHQRSRRSLLPPVAQAKVPRDLSLKRKPGRRCYLSPSASRSQVHTPCLIPIPCCLLPVPYCLLPVPYCLLPVPYCLLPVASSLLPVAYCLLPVLHDLRTVRPSDFPCLSIRPTLF